MCQEFPDEICRDTKAVQTRQVEVNLSLEQSAMSMKQLETFMSRVQSNDSIRDEVQRCGGTTPAWSRSGPNTAQILANLSRWQKDHG